jgi:hypothetical protein
MVFAFRFTWFLVLVFLHVFAAVYLKCYLIHSKVLSLSVFKAFLRLFVFRFIRAFRNISFGIKLS